MKRPKHSKPWLDSLQHVADTRVLCLGYAIGSYSHQQPPSYPISPFRPARYVRFAAHLGSLGPSAKRPVTHVAAASENL